MLLMRLRNKNRVRVDRVEFAPRVVPNAVSVKDIEEDRRKRIEKLKK